MENQIHVLPTMGDNLINDLINSMFDKGFELIDLTKYWRGHNAGTYRATAEEDLLLISFAPADPPTRYHYQYILVYSGNMEKAIEEMNSFSATQQENGWSLVKVLSHNAIWHPSGDSHIRCKVNGMALLFKQTGTSES